MLGRPVQVRSIFFALYFLLLLLIFYAVIQNSISLKIFGNNPVFILTAIQRVTALWAFIMLTFQIVTGARMTKLTERFGGWVFKYHTWEGRIAYGFIFIHLISLLLVNYISKHILDPFYVFSDFCLLCETKTELFYTFGRIAFWLFTAAVIAAVVRTRPWWRQNWRNFHILNYLAFFLILIHAKNIGTDIHSPIIYPIFILGSIAVFLTTIQRIVRR